MAMLSWCVLVLLVIGCEFYKSASALTVTPTPTAGLIAENVAVGTTVVTVSSTGTDITYSLESQAPLTDPKIFAINETSGVVAVADKTHLDFEKAEEFTLVIKATQNTANSLDNGTATVTVTVTDVNEAPTFTEVKYAACVNKGSQGGTSVTQVTAKDEDDGDRLTYSITASPTFEVDSGTGTIKVKSNQTIGETPTSYNMTITATDDDTSPKTGTTTVSIDVGDPCPGVNPAPNFATTTTASFCLFLVSVVVHLLCLW